MRKPNYINDEIIKTIDMIAGAKDSQLGFDKTIIGKIISISNSEIGEYWIEYQETRFKAYASTINPNVVYQVGSSVYIKVPGGDFSNKKIIEGIANSGTGLMEFFNYEPDELKEVWEFYNDTNTYEILAGATKENIYYEKVIYNNETEKIDTNFKNVFESYPNLRISAEFKTDFHGDPQYGNYGLLIEFYTIDEEGSADKNKTFTVRLDVSNFSGSLWEYFTFSPQYAVYKVTNTKLANLKKITFFQEKLVYDKIGNEINDTKPNIFIRNIKMTLNDIQEATGSLYEYGIIPVGGKGVTFDYNSDSITFQAYLTYAKQNILKNNTAQVFWFKQNPEVTVGHEKYNTYAGPGWQEITDLNKVDFNLLKLKGADIYDKEDIRVVMVYEQSKTFIVDKTLMNRSMPRFSIIKKIENDGTYLQLLDGFPEDSKKDTVADWYVLLDDGKYEKCNTELTNKIKINEYMLHSTAKFTAWIEVKDNVKDVTFKVPYNYQYINENQKNSVNAVFAGPDTFLYDESGRITFSESQKEMLINTTITLGQNTVIKSITWKGPDDIILTQIGATNQKSMLMNLWVDNENTIHFHIRQNYNMTYTKNTITIIIETVDGNTFSFNKVINFVKQGEQGSSGTAYSLVIEQCDKDGNEIPYQPMIYGIDKTWSPIYLRPQLYLNGDAIKDGETLNGKTYHIDFNTQKIGVKANVYEKESSDGATLKTDYYEVVGIESDGPQKEQQGQYFIRFVATVCDNNENKNINTISYYHPIMIGVGFIQPSDLVINNLPNTVIYSAAGDEPNYNSQPIDLEYAGKQQTNFTTPTSLTPNTLSITTSSSYGYYIFPTTNYTGANFPTSNSGEKFKPMGAYRIDLTSFGSETYIIQPVVMILSTELTKKLNGYDGSSVLATDEIAVENTKELVNVTGVGDVGGSTDVEGNFTKDTIKNGAIIGKDEDKERTGFYLYDKDGTPVSYLTSDGNSYFNNGMLKLFEKGWSLGKGIDIKVEEDAGGNETFEIKDFLTIKRNKEGKVNLSLSELFLEQIKDYLTKEGS